MANLHAAAAAAAQAQAAHQAVASNKAVQAAAVAAAASSGTSGTESTNPIETSGSHLSSSTHNSPAIGQFLAAPTPLTPLHPSTHHPIASHHHPHAMFFPSSVPTQTGNNGCSNSTGTGIPPTTSVSASAVTALSSLV